MAEKTANFGVELMRMAEKSLLLQFLDHIWKDHLLQLDHLRQGINLRAYAQRDPLNEYKREAFELFEAMLVSLREQVTSALSHVELRVPPPEPALPMARRRARAGNGRGARHRPTGRPARRPAPSAAPAAATAPAAAGPAPRRPRAPPVGRHPPQRPLPLRLRQEIQALPRPRVTRRPRDCFATLAMTTRGKSLLRLYPDKPTQHGLLYWRHWRPQGAGSSASREAAAWIYEPVQCVQARLLTRRDAMRPVLSQGRNRIKAGSRQKKIDLIDRLNPEWRDLYDDL